jgi:hypothetical protein
MRVGWARPQHVRVRNHLGSIGSPVLPVEHRFERDWGDQTGPQIVWSELSDFGCICEKNFPNSFNVIWVVQMGLEKYFRFLSGQITGLFRAIPCSMRGAFRDRHGRWARDAVDADALLTNCADRGRRSRVVLTPRRWRHACESVRKSRWQQSPVTGESTKETVKTIVQGMPGFPVDLR